MLINKLFANLFCILLLNTQTFVRPRLFCEAETASGVLVGRLRGVLDGGLCHQVQHNYRRLFLLLEFIRFVEMWPGTLLNIGPLNLLGV